MNGQDAALPERISGDPCTAQNGGCDALVTCTPDGSNASCGACPSGYNDSAGDGTRCTDIDECTQQTSDCKLHSTCSNTPGGYACPCDTGFHGDGQRECRENALCDATGSNCASSASCRELSGSAYCVCNSGYEGDGVTCSDIDECLKDNGGCSAAPMAECTNKPGAAASCTCPRGYAGSGVGTAGCTDIDECRGPNACAVDYPCQNLTPFYTCRGQFADWPPAYSAAVFAVNPDGTVSDSRNQLVWQQTLDATLFTWAEAKTYCGELSLAGKGWRLPTKAELESLVDDSRLKPAIDPTAFPGTPSEWFWTASPYARDASLAWVVVFNTGSSGSYSASETFHARCVRTSASTVASSGAGGGAPPGRYVFPADGTVYDTRTKLTWQRGTDAGTYTFSDAHSYCMQLSLDGNGWRLPTRAELVTLVDPTTYSPAIDSTAFPSTPTPQFWSSSAVANPALNSAWTVYSSYGFVGTYDGNNMVHVRCVR